MARVVPCLVPRCPEFAEAGRSYCARHLRERWQLGLTGERTTGRLPERVRRIVMRRQRGICPCGAKATVVHHKRSAYDDGLDDLIALCADCHREAHAAGRSRS